MLPELRDEIEAVSFDVLRLLNRRQELALAIAAEKRRTGLPMYDPQREQELLERLAAASAGPLRPEAVRRIFRAILDESLTAMQTDGSPKVPEQQE